MCRTLQNVLLDAVPRRRLNTVQQIWSHHRLACDFLDALSRCEHENTTDIGECYVHRFGGLQFNDLMIGERHAGGACRLTITVGHLHVEPQDFRRTEL